MDGGGGSGECYYSILEIRNDASFSDVRSAYHKLALKWHPDRCAKNRLSPDEAKRRFQKIQEAYTVLSDQGKRSMYDAGLLNFLDDDEDEGMNDFLHELFGMMKQESRKNESLEDLQKTFVEMFGEDMAKMEKQEDKRKGKRKAAGLLYEINGCNNNSSSNRSFSRRQK